MAATLYRRHHQRDPNAPRLGGLSGKVSAQYGNYDAYQLTGIVNVPLGDPVAVRLAGRQADSMLSPTSAKIWPRSARSSAVPVPSEK